MRIWVGLCLGGLLAASSPARGAELGEITVAQQYGVSFLPLMLMEHHGLVEKHAMTLGIKLKANWIKVAGPSVMNDGLLSGTMHIVSQGAPSLITLWDKTRDGIGVKGMSALTTYPLYLVSRNPEVRTIKDLSEKDKIAVPSIKISTQAIMLQMAAAEIWGEKEYARLDPLTVSLSHPDAVLALTNNAGGVNAHFATSPFYEQEMKLPGAHLITTNYDILGGPATALLITTTTKFRQANPNVTQAFYNAMKEAVRVINDDKRAAAKLYLELANDRKNSVEDILAIISDKDYAFTLQPQKVLKTAEFMAKIGTVKQAPKVITDLFFPEFLQLSGD
ncbi:MAG: ABC transporter substrate-binding protein [Xanthobacteraceae bacterium]